MPVSSRGYFVMAKETTAGTPPTRQSTVSHNNLTLPKYWAYPAEEIEFMPGKEFIDFREIRGSRQAYTTLDGPFRPTANLRGAVYPGAALGQLLWGALGDVRVYGTDGNDNGSDPDEPGAYVTNNAWTLPDPDTQKAYEMIFSDGATLPNFTLERSDGRDGVATIVEQLSGCKVESLQFQANFGEKVNLTAQFQGAKRPATLATNTALGASDIIYPGQEAGAPGEITPLYFNRAAIRLDGSALTSGYMKSVNFEMRNTITRQEVLKSTSDATYPWKISETVDSYKLFEGGMECTLSGSAVFENTDFYDKVINGATVSIELFLASDSLSDANASGTTDDVPYLLYFYWPKAKVSRASIPFRAGEVIESDVEFKVIYDPSATIAPFGSNSAISGIEGGSVFVKMLSHANGKLANGILRPSFF